MNTRRYPRTLVEAFGPYADRGPIVEMRSPSPLAMWINTLLRAVFGRALP